MKMWIIYALGSALFAGMTAILAKIGIKNTDSNLSTAIRTVVVLVFSWLIVFIVGSQHTITTISTYTLIFLILSGCATGASWLCYFKALQLGDVNKITPIDKSSAILTIILAFLFLGETPTPLMCLGVVVFASGTYFMIQRKNKNRGEVPFGLEVLLFILAIFIIWVLMGGQRNQTAKKPFINPLNSTTAPGQVYGPGEK